MRPLIAAAVLAAAFPGSAFGAGLVQQWDLPPQAPRRALSPGTFELVGLHWRGTGTGQVPDPEPRRALERLAVLSDEDAQPDSGPRGLRDG